MLLLGCLTAASLQSWEEEEEVEEEGEKSRPLSGLIIKKEEKESSRWYLFPRGMSKKKSQATYYTWMVGGIMAARGKKRQNSGKL